MTQIDVSASQVIAAIESSGQPGLETLPPSDARAAFAMSMSMLQAPPVTVGAVTDLEAETARGVIPMRRYLPESASPKTLIPVIVFFHGGGFVLGDLDVFDRQCRRLCRASTCAVISVDYRLAPEYRFPAAIDDAFAAVQWIADNAGHLDVDADRLAVMGDSAGGNLAAGVCLMARQAGAPSIRHQTLVYPVTNLSAKPIDGVFLTASMMRHFLAAYLNRDAEGKDWRASPVLAQSHAGLPPATVLVAGHDPLHDDGIAYCAALRNAAVPVELLRYPGQIHGFLLMDAVIPEAAKAIDQIAALLRAALLGPPL